MEIKERIVGTWLLKSWTYKNQEGVYVDYLGRNPSGMLTYTNSGRMSVQIMKAGRKKFESGELLVGTPLEIKEAFETFFAYFGSYKEKSPGVLLHKIEGSNFPNWVGETEVRSGFFKGDDLILSAPGILSNGDKVTFEVTWIKH